MKKYEKIEKLYYKRKNIDKEYKKRIENDSVVSTKLEIYSEYFKGKVPLFYNFLPKHFLLHEKIYENSKLIIKMFDRMPALIILYTVNKLFVNEMLYTNEIEGIFSTKKAIYSAIKNEKKDKSIGREKLVGITQKYKKILQEEDESIKDVSDYRKIYDELFEDFLDEDKYKLDGKFFRKETVELINSMNEVVHRGLFGEENIIKEIEKIIEFEKNEDISSLIKSIISHFYLEYIHPFYDGNGRFGRYLLSFNIAKIIDKYTALSLSYIIAQNKVEYYKSFKEVEAKYGLGELTFFVENMLNNIVKGQESIINLLGETLEKIDYMLKVVDEIKKDNKNLSEKEKEILFVYIQDYLFNGFDNITNRELQEVLGIKSRITISNYTKQMEKKGFIKKVCEKPLKYVINDWLAEKF